MTSRPVRVTLREMLPRGVRDLADMLGDEALMRLVEAHGGTRLAVPGRVGEADPLAALLGIKSAKRIVTAYGPGVILVPLCKDWRCEMLRRQGLSYAAIGRRLGMHEQSVWRRLGKKRPAADTRQLQLRIE